MVRRRGNIWIWLIGVPVILWAIAHWGFYYFVKSELDRAIFQVAPQATIHYRELGTSLSGKIDVRGIEIVPAGQEQEIFVRAVHVQGPDAISYLAQKLPALGENTLPDTLNVVIKDVEIDISGDRAAQLDGFGERVGLRKTDGKPLDICQAGSGPSMSQLQELGFEKIRMDMRLGYQYIPSSQKLYGNFSLHVQDMQRLTMSLALDNVPALDGQKLLGALLSGLKITYENAPEFGRKVTEYCAQKRGVTPEDFKLLMVDDFIREIERNGILLGPGLRHALKEYVTSWGSLLIEFSPPNPVGVFALMRLPREQVAEKLGLQLAVNDRLVTDLSFRILDGVSLVRRNSGAGEKQEQKPLPPKVEYMWEYRKVPVGRLSNYLDRRVILKERDGRTRKGILVEVKDGRISIQQRISGGKFTAHLLADNIVSAQARVKVPVSTPQQAVSQKADANNAKAAAEQGQQAGG
ncbi:hypothetical protein [Thiolapillus sp.]